MAHYIKSLTFLKDFRCFKIYDKIDFKSGLNLIVGDQGTGKSTILGLIRKPKNYQHDKIAFLEIPEPCSVGGFDFEKDNLRTQPAFSNNIPMEFQIQSMFMSHGEVNTFIHQSLTESKNAPKNAILILDEPDQALSIRSTWHLCKILEDAINKNNLQVIAAVHNPIIITFAKKVYSVEHRKWMKSTDFIRSQKPIAKEEQK